MKMMIKYTEDELKDILEKHAKWLNNEDDGKQAILIYADLSGVDLRRANLSGANLSGADFSKSNLRGANLRGANLSGVNLRKTNLGHANLSVADLWYADVSVADLWHTNLRGSNLSGVDFSESNLRYADLRGASLWHANLNGASLFNTYIDFPLACPDEGAFIGWKKCFIHMPVVGTGLMSRSPVIVKLCILSDAKRSSSTGRKCRCDRAEVLDIQDMHGNSLVDVVAYSKHDHGFIYEVGKVVSVDDFDDCRWHECAPGIHFFITREEAANY